MLQAEVGRTSRSSCDGAQGGSRHVPSHRRRFHRARLGGWKIGRLIECDDGSWIGDEDLSDWYEKRVGGPNVIEKSLRAAETEVVRAAHPERQEQVDQGKLS